MENFFASLKTERAHDVDLGTRPETRAALCEYIAVFYNGQRRHSLTECVSQAERERAE